MFAKLMSAAVTALVLASPASASYLKIDQVNNTKYVCSSEGNWFLRYPDGAKSTKSMAKGECIEVLGSTHDQKYIRVRGVSGSRWLLNSNPAEIADLGINQPVTTSQINERKLADVCISRSWDLKSFADCMADFRN